MNKLLFKQKSSLKASLFKRFYSHNIQKLLEPYTKNKKIISWIQETTDLCDPKDVQVCTGSIDEYNSLIDGMIKKKTIKKIDKRDNCYLARSDPQDVARVESRTFICSKTKEEAGPTNNWENPEKMKQKLNNLFKGSMKGRTLYVVPFSMGPLNGDISKIGIELTDSPYVVCSMRTMTIMGKEIFEKLEKNDEFVPCVHTSGKPIIQESDDVAWPCNPEKYIVHFPEERSIFSYGSSYGGNALLGKKCLALRIASKMGKDEGWLAEHMLILGITNPEGVKKYIAAAFPSACGKTNLALLTPSIPGWKVETMGDDIAWMKFGSDGRLYAINPENGFFGVAPGTSVGSNPNAMKMLTKNTIFTNVAETPEGDIWWEGMTKEKPAKLVDWKGNDWTPKSKEKAAHGNSRFCVPIQQCPVLDENFEKSPNGVPIDAILFGGRRDTTIPLVFQSFNWNHGVLVGASISSEQTEAAEGRGVRHDPFAMLPFCGYNMGDYFNHWIQMQKKTTAEKLPKIFQVNWFKKDQNGDYLWPGFAENSRVLKWVFESATQDSTENQNSIKTPIGIIPKKLDTEGIQIDKETMDKLFEIDAKEWQKEVLENENYLKNTFGDKLPKELANELELIKKNL
eukprot:gene4760-8342_t